ncbi:MULTISPECIES: TPM domain-containing protein [Hydrocarboniphaga]|jgi:uncharacterized membrane protein|uniref:TPM domain-containing protein n=1 Tax=Hydrocarboniphaga effusa AP103 TaxID=1172194 RepID=I8TDS8_9GAMM|nr:MULTISPECIES: TPM domain-containing protein [Hydrocarboniphaga]EIT71858.1 hypothetical protein WQQ_19950 [Hydrocarboniphaga effusa AP103]MDZ4077441.1 TPM domain-containing protein [Hydrocarboniphaga sp.]
MAANPNRLHRLLRHLLVGRWTTRKRFPASVLADIEAAVKRHERLHPGEVRFAVEAGLSLPHLWASVSPRERAIEVFTQLRVWDTEDNNGVLIYVLLADRDVEIVADRGVAGGRVPQSEWDACCRVIEKHFAAGRFGEGAIAGIESVSGVLARYPCGRADVGDELPNAPVLL